MHLWELEKWKKTYANANVRRGLRVRYESNVDEEVKAAIRRFLLWIRWQYDFPMRVQMYVKASESIRAQDGTYVNGTFFGPFDPFAEPYIKIATGDFHKDMLERGRDNALATILGTVAHELSHYYQWINGLKKTERSEEYQATYYSNLMLEEYACYTEHP